MITMIKKQTVTCTLLNAMQAFAGKFFSVYNNIKFLNKRNIAEEVLDSNTLWKSSSFAGRFMMRRHLACGVIMVRMMSMIRMFSRDLFSNFLYSSRVIT